MLSQRTSRKKHYTRVAVGHAVVLAVLFYLQGPPRDKVHAVMVKLVDAPPRHAPVAAEIHDVPEPAPTEPVAPDPVTPTPPPRVPPETTRQAPPPRPPPSEPPPTPPVRPPAEPVDKPTPKPAKPTEPEWRPRSADDVRKSANFKAAEPPAPVAPPKVDFDSMRERLRQHASTQTPRATRPSRPSAASVSRYADAVRAVMYSAWEQPTRAEVGGSPVVRVRFWVRSDGRITKTHVLSMSKISTMDRSVLSVIKSVRHLPALSAYGIAGDSLTIDVVFELE